MIKCTYPRCDRVQYFGEGKDGKHCWNHLRLLAREAREKATGKAKPMTLQCQYGVGINQCPNPARAAGLCMKHYQRQRTADRAEERREAQGLD